jgi:hypothetical protein
MSPREWLSRLAPWSWVPALILWAVSVFIWVNRLLDQRVEPHRSWLLDWHAYAAGGHQFVAGDLYRVDLVSPYPIPISAYNMPPGSALITVPFLPFPDTVGGTLWVIVNVAAVAVAAVLLARIVDLRPVALWSGVGFFAYSYFNWAALPALLGNNSPILLLIVAGFVAAELSRRFTLGGVLLGIAIATKLWPAAYLVVLARERSWRTAAWAVGTAGVIVVGSLLWLGGIGTVGPMLKALAAEVEPGPRQWLLGFTWLRVHTDWWPDWGGYVVAALILLIPARGLTGYGLATLAGMAAIPNLWRHYIGSIIFGVALLVRGLVDRVGEGASSRDDRESTKPHAVRRPATGP